MMRVAATLVLLALSLCLAPETPVFAAQAPLPPRDLETRAGFDQHLGAQVPVDLRFRDANGRDTTLAAIAQGKPVLLSLGYYRCPNLCGMVLHGLGDAASKLSLRPGSDYQIVFASIDPHETSADAAQAAHRLARMHPDADVDRWHFLAGDESSIHALAEAVGFRYFYDERNKQYAHAAGAVVLTGQGKIAQYFFGVAFPPDTLRLAVIDASHGQLGSLIDQLVLLCCGYDPATGRYSLLIGRVMQILGIGFALLLGAWLLWVRRKGRATA